MKTVSTLRPKKVRILGREYGVEFTDSIKELGLCHTEECLIQVREGVHPVEEADSLLHEILHAAHFLMDIGLPHKVEENVVRKTATALIQIFLDNPHLLTYLANAGPPPTRRR